MEFITFSRLVLKKPPYLNETLKILDGHDGSRTFSYEEKKKGIKFIKKNR